MSERPTPETDDLDRELHNPRVLQDRYSEMMEHAQNMERERDEARELNAKLIALAERATDDLRWFYESHADGISLELEKLKEDAK